MSYKKILPRYGILQNFTMLFRWNIFNIHIKYCFLVVALNQRCLIDSMASKMKMISPEKSLLGDIAYLGINHFYFWYIIIIIIYFFILWNSDYWITLIYNMLWCHWINLVISLLIKSVYFRLYIGFFIHIAVIFIYLLFSLLTALK